MKRLVLLALIAAASVLLLSGCGKSSSSEDTINIYYLNKAKTTITPVSFTPSFETDTGVNDKLNELITRLKTQPINVNLIPVIQDFDVQSLSGDGEIAYIDLSLSYYAIGTIDKALVRAAVVNTLCQLDEVQYVQFTVNGKPMLYDDEIFESSSGTAGTGATAGSTSESADLQDESSGLLEIESSVIGMTSSSEDGSTSSESADSEENDGIPENRVVGLLSADSFIYNSENEIRNNEKTRLHLYFANSSGDKLVDTYRTAVYNSNVPEERLIVEEVLSGPNSDFSYPTVNSETSILSITLRDKVVYLDLSKQFLTKAYDVTPEVAVYSIVNSLCELNSVNSVQITVEGSANITYMDSISLASPLKMNTDIMQNGSN